MSVTHPTGLSCNINRKIVLFTAILSGCALLAFVMLNYSHPTHAGYKSIIYGASLFTCSFFSYLYTIRFSLLPTSLLRQLDHSAIFLLIAGTYTPFAARSIHGPFGVPLIHMIWALTLAGICLRIFFRSYHNRLFVGLYLALGWLFLMAIPDIMHQISGFSLAFLGLGAAVYSLGAVIFARDIGKWTDPVWHGCVLSASALHFIAVLNLSIGPLAV